MKRNFLKMRIRSVSLLSIVFVACTVFVGYYVKDHSTDLIVEMAREDSDTIMRSLESFRTLYTQEVVQKVKAKGLKVSHQFSGDAGSIPLPATLTKLIGAEIGKKKGTSKAYLYSKYPFPWNKQAGGLNDSFRKEAWNYLVANPKGVYSAVENVDGVEVLRYAKSDVMRKACINCHNGHPQTPKTGWKQGDVRGVLEVQRPIQGFVYPSETRTVTIFWMVVAIGGLGLLAFWGFGKMLVATDNYYDLMTKNEKIAKEKAQELVNEQRKALENTTQMATLGEMAAGIAHEINGPLTVICGNIAKFEIIDNKNELEIDDARQVVSKIKEVVNHINQIVKGLSSASRKGDNDPFEPVGANEIIRDCIVLAQDKLKRYEVDLKVNYLDAESSIECRQTQISQIVLNLISNSIDAIKEKEDRWININLADAGNFIEISVVDCGPGIPKELREKIFDSFYTSKAVGSGTGLGLSISQRIVRAHQGRLYINEKSKNTCFVISLPKKHIDEETLEGDQQEGRKVS